MELKRKILSKDATAKGKKKKDDPAEADRGRVPDQDRGTGSPSTEPEWDREETAAEAPASGGKRSRLRKAVLFGVPTLCALALVSGLLLFKFDLYAQLFAHPAPKIEPVTSIKRPIPVPDYKEMLDFLLLYDLGGQKALTAFRMEFGFQNPNRYQKFKEENVVLRDTVYSFLQNQNLPGNNNKIWQTIVEKDLLDYLKIKMPQSQADTIRLTQVENL